MVVIVTVGPRECGSSIGRLTVRDIAAGVLGLEVDQVLEQLLLVLVQALDLRAQSGHLVVQR